MFENVAEHLDEAVRLSERCPDKYQLSCFEALIRVLAQSGFLSALNERGQNEHGGGHSFNGDADLPPTVSSSSYADGDSAMKQQAGTRGSLFLEQYQIPGAFISRVYHLDGDSYRIIAKDLNERTNSKKQIKLALLLGAGGLLLGGQPTFSKERLIEASREYGAYDGPNFASHMKKQRDLFIAHGNEWSLTIPAQQRAAEAIKELAS